MNTIDTRPQHYTHGCHTVGSGPLHVMILGSCRVVPYANYFEQLNGDNRFTIHLIDVVHFYEDETGNRVDAAEYVARFETNEFLLNAIKQTKWFIHEFTVSFSMFNTSRESAKNIYQFGMSAEVDISIPNWNDVFILFQELVDLDAAVHEWAKNDIAATGELSEELKAKVKEKGLARIQDFLEICAKTDLPEFGSAFYNFWRERRYWWTGNHVSSEFTEEVFALICAKYLNLDLTPEFWKWCEGYNPYSTPCSKITKYDREAFGIQWPQPTEELTV